MSPRTTEHSAKSFPLCPIRDLEQVEADLVELREALLRQQDILASTGMRLQQLAQLLLGRSLQELY